MKKTLLLLLSAALLFGTAPDSARAQAQPPTSPALVPPDTIKGEEPGGKTSVQLNDFGSTEIAYFSIPNREPLGGIVVISDTWGLDSQVKAAVAALAAQGYVAIAPDLFNGRIASDATAAGDLARSIEHASVRATVRASVRLLRESPRFRVTHVAVVGWGLGSGLALENAAPGEKSIDAVACIGTPANVDWKKAARGDIPLLFLLDPGFPPALRADFDTAFKDRKDIEVHNLTASSPAETWPLLLPFIDRTFHTPPKKTLGGLLNNGIDTLNPFKDSDTPKPQPQSPTPAPKPAPAPMPAP